MLKKSFLNHQAKNEQMALQITSMADVFVIILVFLLKSYSMEGLPYEPTMPLNPPTAAGKYDAIDGMKIEVSSKGLALEGRAVSPMRDFRFLANDKDSDGGSLSLRRALAKSRADAAPGQQESGPGRLIVVADEGAPYETIKAVLASAASEGWSDVQLAVSHGN